ncbi:Putative RING-H2 finger protein ATL71 [Dendrobium catenatum]|uniref:RING-H2 finger protein ATL71 n=1 Tax=Dendrobium catenatum TaxID=906689 RepID=A0A2I0WGW4_9ASPA|nr:Putative RING-H2 finger protein ATL71 [Dendrobium catenatum]
MTIYMSIFVLFLITAITFIIYWLYFRPTAPPPLQPRTGTWPNYAEAIRQDPRAATTECCVICLENYDDMDEGEENPVKILPSCGHVFHATSVDLWLQRNPTCPMCRSSVMLG